MTDVLTAIDDALDTGVATDNDPLTRELQELALALHADAPEPTHEFSEWLDRRGEGGFPQRGPARPPLGRQLLHRVAARSPARQRRCPTRRPEAPSPRWCCPRRTAASRPGAATGRSSARSGWSSRCRSTTCRAWPSRSPP